MSAIRIASWNVNSLRVRLAHVLQWLEGRHPHVLGLQETKVTDPQFPIEEFTRAGYHAVFNGQKTYNGVALLSRTPVTDVLTDIPGLDDQQRRILVATAGDIRIVNLYVVNGSEVGSDKYDYKLGWLEKVNGFIAQQLSLYPRLVVLGDFNIAPDDRDVHDPEGWRERILCSTPERQALRQILSHGLVDTFRLFHEEGGSYSWWDYRAAAFRRNMGLRIDLILASADLASQCVSSEIDAGPRALDRPSDHAPVYADFRNDQEQA